MSSKSFGYNLSLLPVTLLSLLSSFLFSFLLKGSGTWVIFKNYYNFVKQ